MYRDRPDAEMVACAGVFGSGACGLSIQVDILLQKRRDKAAAKLFFKRMLRSSPVPRKIVTDQLRSYQAAKAGIPEQREACVRQSGSPAEQPG
jgi:transposase-like protein